MVQKLALYLPEAQRHPSGRIAEQVQVRPLFPEALFGSQAHASLQRHLV